MKTKQKRNTETLRWLHLQYIAIQSDPEDLATGDVSHSKTHQTYSNTVFFLDIWVTTHSFWPWEFMLSSVIPLSASILILKRRKKFYDFFSIWLKHYYYCNNIFFIYFNLHQFAVTIQIRDIFEHHWHPRILCTVYNLSELFNLRAADSSWLVGKQISDRPVKHWDSREALNTWSQTIRGKH